MKDVAALKSLLIEERRYASEFEALDGNVSEISHHQPARAGYQIVININIVIIAGTAGML